MMGRQSSQPEWFCDPVNVFARIPENHLLRRLNRILDLDFVRQEVSAKYGRNGQVSVDPVVIMKMMLLLFLDDVKSARELMRIIPLRLDYLYFLGFGLEDLVPHHSVLSKARQRWGGEVFERLFARTVEQCWRAGLGAADKVHIDSSLIRADASLNSVQAVAATVGKLTVAVPPPDAAVSAGSAPVADASAPALALLPAPAPAAAGVPTPGAAPAGAEDATPVNERHVVTTDPDSTVVRHRSGKSVPSYKCHRLLDDQHGVITALATTTGAVGDASMLEALVAQHTTRLGQKPRVATADSAYGTSANFIALAQQGIRTHMADLRSRQRNPRAEGIYPPEQFLYDAAQDRFTCPAGRHLTRHHFHAGRGYFEYRTAKGACAACPLRSACTRDKSGRTLKRYRHQELLDQARAQAHSAAAKADRQRRQWLQERNFGEAAVEHGFKRARWRRQWRQQIQDLLIAAVQNWKILLRKGAPVPAPRHPDPSCLPLEAAAGGQVLAARPRAAVWSPERAEPARFAGLRPSRWLLAGPPAAGAPPADRTGGHFSLS